MEASAPNSGVRTETLIDLERARNAIEEFVNATHPDEEETTRLCDEAHRRDNIIRSAAISSPTDAAVKMRSVIQMYEKGDRTDGTDEVVLRQVIRWLENITSAGAAIGPTSSERLKAMDLEYESLMDLTLRLNASHGDEELGLYWERRVQSFYDAVETLPVSADTAPLRAKAINLIHGGDLSGFSADSECTDARIARQLIRSLAGVA